MITYPLNDVEYLAEDAELFNCPRTSGVYSEKSFDYTLAGGNRITIGKGIAWIKNAEFAGKVVANKSNVTLDAGLPDAFYPRMDAVVIRFDAIENETKLIIKKGVPSNSLEPPAIERTDTIYELHLYYIIRLVADNALFPGQIIDMRLSEGHCGLMADAVTRLDTSAIYSQYMSMLNNFEEKVGEIVTEDLTAAKESGEFNPVKGVDYWTAEDKEEIIEEAVSRDFGSQGLEYTLTENDDGYSVTGIGECPDADITIPSRHENLPVTTIGDSAFDGKSQITSVTFPSSIKKISSFAFRNCENLVKVSMGDGITSIGNSAFFGCNSIKAIHLHAGLEEIGGKAFATNTELEVIFHGTSEQWNSIKKASDWATSYKLFVTYNGNMVGAQENFDGASGYVPAPMSGDQEAFLRGDGKWAYPSPASSVEYAKSAGTATTATTANRMSSLATATDNATRPVWFSDSNTPTIPRKDNDFSYNPSTNTLKVKNINTSSTVKRVFAPDTLMLTYGKSLYIGELPDGKELDDLMLVTIGAPYKDDFLGVVGYGVREYSDDEMAFRFSVDYAYAHLMFSAEIGHGDGSMNMIIGQDGAPVRGWSISSVEGAKLLEITEGDLVPQKVCITLYFK